VAAPKSPVVEIIYFNAGGGHRAAATALQRVIEEHRPQWRVKPVNLQELLDAVDPVSRWARKILSRREIASGKKFQTEDIYNALLRKGWTFGSHTMLRALQQGIKALAPDIEALLQRHWRDQRPDLVVSLIPNFNRVLFRALRRDHPQVPYVTVMTDIADYPPHFWQEKQDQLLICGSRKAVRQARSLGYPRERVFQVSGMILKPEFYRGEGKDRRLEREKIGLDPDRPTALIMFGGNGSKVSIKIIRQLEEAGLELQYIVMCGRDEKLREALEVRPSCRAIGFTDRVPEYMRMADFFIGKPGPGSISEAIHLGLPVIVERNKRTLPQERYNTKWVERWKIGIVVKNFARNGTAKAVRALLTDNFLAELQQNARLLENRAVFEILEILEQIVAAS
jgi:hypothetical protein